MNFDKFKTVKPDSSARNKVLSAVGDGNADYVMELSSIEYKQKKNKKWLVILSETAAAVAIVVAVALWAILGRGIQMGDDPIGSHADDSSMYHVMYNEAEKVIVHGADDLQKFFDDFANGKACSLELFVTDRKSEDKYIGYSVNYSINEDGSGSYYHSTGGSDLGFEDAVFGLYEFGIWEESFDFMRFLFADDIGNVYIQSGTLSFPLPINTLTNTHQNSDRVYDTSKAEPVVTEDYTVKSGEQSLKDFFEHYYKGLVTGVTVDGKSFCFDGYKLYAYDGTLNELSDLRYDRNEQTDITDETVTYGTVRIESSSYNIVELKREEIIRLGLLYNAGGITAYSQTESVIISRADNNELIESLITALKNDPKDQYKTDLSGNCDYTVELNDDFSLALFLNSDGTLSDMVGFNYSFYSSPLAIKVSDELHTAVQAVIDLVPKSEELTDDIKAQLVSLSFEYRLDYLCDFDSPDQLAFEDMLNFAFAMDGFPRRLKAERLNYNTELMLGVTFDVADDYYVPMSVEGSPDYGSNVKEVVSLDRFIIADEQAITVEFDIYHSAEEATPYRIQKVTYTTKDGYTPSKIVSNYNGIIDEDGNRVYNTANHNPVYAKRWQYLRKAIDEYYKEQGEFEEYMLRNLKFYSTPDENGIFSFQFIGDVKPRSELADKYEWLDEEGWTYNHWETLWFKETADGITCIGAGETAPITE